MADTHMKLIRLLITELSQHIMVWTSDESARTI